MRCKKHLSDHSSSFGVCASCLRERLIALKAQAQAQASVDRRKQQQDTPAPPLVFPRSVSPYVSRRKSDAYPHLFYSTPQVGPTGVKKRSGKFSLISNLFRSRSDSVTASCPDSSEPSSSFSPSSWFFSTVFPSRRKKKSTLCYADDSMANGQISNRGISPPRETESDEDLDRSPMAAVRRTRTTSCGKNVSVLAFCLSPLVRASPSQHWNQRGGFLPEFAYSGEVRSTMKPHLSTAASFCANRSKKLADFGRVNHNR